MSKLVIILLSVLLLGSCKENEPASLGLGKVYYPMEIGRSVTYKVDSIIYDDRFLPQIVSDTISFELREEITDTFRDNANRLTYRIERFKRRGSGSWIIDKVWSANVSDANLQKVEDDLRFIKLVFPMEEGKKWDGNVFIDKTEDNEYLENWDYEIVSFKEPYELNNNFFSETARIIQTDQDISIEKIYSEEVYAKGIGMIFKEFQFLQKQDVLADWTKAESGYIVRYTAIEYE